ncbi:hypothetical protein [Nocardioides dongkuii]|uniref:hypothetical protein n=1 Tax=Nocardioides dongkuii TaxID=2760089 RepID=UPI001878005D|nr:hypothetical protein [Nocardioides dongkuii]
MDRLRALASTGLAAVLMFAARWIYVGEKVDGRRRRVASIAIVLAAVAGVVVLSAGQGILSGLLFGEKPDFGLMAAIPQYVALLFIAVGGTLSFLFLAPLMRTRTIAQAAWLGSAIGVPSIALGANVAGLFGASLGVLAAEGAVVAVLLTGILGMRLGRHAGSKDE